MYCKYFYRLIKNRKHISKLKTYNEFVENNFYKVITVIEAEAKGESWLQRNWRPIAMLTFLVLVICDSFGLLAFRLSDDAWTLLQIGIGGYVVGRSGEKIQKNVKR